MKVQSCPSCGTRYNVERVPPGKIFECKTCGDELTVGESSTPPARFALGLLVAGILVLLGLLLWANPEFGVKERAWPWEIVQGQASLATKAAIVMWVLAGVWALISSFGLAVRTRSALTAALAGVLLLVSTGDGGFALGDLRTDLSLVVGIAMAALAGGLLVHDRPGRGGVARALAFGGGLLIAGMMALRFSGNDTLLQQMVATVREWFGGDAPVDPWRDVFPQWALLLAGVVGLLVGMGTRGSWLTWTGVGLLLVFLLLPIGADVADKGFEGDTWTVLAEYGWRALVSTGLAIWWLGAASVADLVRAGGHEA